MEDNLKQLHTLKRITLTATEQHAMRSRLAHYVQETPIETQSMFEVFVSHGLRVALSSFLFFILIGGSVSALANSSLPGDPFYNVKLNVNEKVQEWLTKNTPEQKVAFQQERIENRLKEIQLLAETKTLTKEKRAVAEEALSKHTTKFSAELGELSLKQPEAALKATAKLEETLRVQKDALTLAPEAAASGQNEAVLEVVDSALASVVQEEQRIIQAELSKVEDELLNEDPIDDIDSALAPSDEAPADIEEKQSSSEHKTDEVSAKNESPIPPVTPHEP
ncbi:MAG TPA: hypothetical protein VLB02_01475 [Candidatus Paceibacterota bacterium]|nr:hypothetical protein [Candidatus Paceibacterota bacterium]